MLHSMEMIQGSNKRQKVNCKPNCHPNMEDLMRMTPDVKAPRLPRLRQSYLLLSRIHQQSQEI